MISIKKTSAYHARKCTFMIAVAAASCLFVQPAKAKTAAIKTIFVDSTSLKAFEGIYEMNDNKFTHFVITAVGDKLIAKNVDGDQKLTLTRTSDLAFGMPDDDGDETVPVIFSKNDAGEIFQLTVAGKQIWTKVKNYKPVVEVSLTAAQLKAYEGKYEFENKKGTFLQITATATGLTLKQLWDNREIPFIAVGDNTFLNKQAAFPLKFTIDQNGNAIKVLAFNRDMWDKVAQ